MHKLFFLLLLFPFSFFAQVTVKVKSPLNYRIGLPNKWDTVCVLTGNVASYEHVFIATGTLNFGPKAIFELELVNDSTVPLIIANAYWGEPNIQPEWTKEPIMPGKAGKMRFTCHTSLRPDCPINKSSTVQTNFGPMTIHFKGTVLPKHLWIDRNTSVLERDRQVKTSFTVSHKTCGDCPDGFVIDSVLTDAFTEVTFGDSAVCADSSAIFRVTCRPGRKMPQCSRVRVYIRGTVVEHYVFITEKKKKRK